MTDAGEISVRIAETGQLVQVNPQAWETLNFYGLVALVGNKFEELLKRVEKLIKKNPTKPANRLNNLGPLIESFFSSEVAVRYEFLQLKEQADGIQAIRNQGLHCNINGEGIGGPIQFYPSTDRREKLKQAMKTSREKILRDYGTVAEKMVPLLIFLRTITSVENMAEKIKSRGFEDEANADDEKYITMHKSLTEENQRLVAGYRSIKANYAAQISFFHQFKQLCRTSDEYRKQTESMTDKEDNVQFFHFLSSKDLTKLFIDAYNLSQAEDVSATETDQQSNVTGKLVSQIAKVISDQDKEAMKRLRDTMDEISQKVQKMNPSHLIIAKSVFQFHQSIQMTPRVLKSWLSTLGC